MGFTAAVRFFQKRFNRQSKILNSKRRQMIEIFDFHMRFL
jgi:hypothetical protein